MSSLNLQIVRILEHSTSSRFSKLFRNPVIKKSRIRYRNPEHITTARSNPKVRNAMTSISLKTQKLEYKEHESAAQTCY